MEFQKIQVNEYFVEPGALEAYESLMPGARSLCVLLTPWKPFKRHGGLNICAYYIAENALYHYATRRATELDGLRIVNGVDIKGTLERAGIATRGENDLTATAEFGSLFAAQLILTKKNLPKTRGANPSPCKHCHRCANVCLGKALPMTDAKKCVRWWMDGMSMPDFAMEGMNWLFGCESCQLACPRNGHVSPVEPPAELAELLTYERMVFLNKSDKQMLADLVGKNMLTCGRVQAQALVLAYKQGWNGAYDAAMRLKDSQHPAIKSAAEFVIRNIKPKKC